MNDGLGIHRRRGMPLLALLAGFALALAACGEPVGAPATGGADPVVADGDGIKVGVLHSLSGTMAISEVSVKDATMLAIEQINEAGGVLGEQLVPVVEDGASDWPTFAEKADKLINDGVATTFGGWTSASRKAMLPVFERHQQLLWYPVQYEGLEASPYIFYTGAAPNQQIVPGLEYLKEQGHRRIFLLGSDYVFPRTANKIIRAYAAGNGLEIVDEEYTPLGHTEYSTIINKVKRAEPDAVFNTLNGDSNVAFFKQLRQAGVSAEDLPVMSVSIAEEEITGIGPDNVAGHLVAWNYFQSLETAENEAFVAAFKERYGEDRVTTDPMEAGYAGVHLWARAVEEAGSTDPEAVKEAAKGLTYDAPGGAYTIDGDNQHLFKTARIGLVQPDGQVEQVWATDEPVKPDPFLKTYDWAGELDPRDAG